MAVLNMRRAASRVMAAGLCFFVWSVHASEYIVTDIWRGSDEAFVSDTLFVFDINTHGAVVGRTGFSLLWQGGLVDVVTPDTLESVASAINDGGVVVGNHSPPDIDDLGAPFVWHKDTGYTPLGLTETAIGFARDINDKHQVAGSFREGDGLWQAYLWRDDGLGSPLNIFSGEQSIATALNNATSTQVVGAAQTVEGRYHAFLWTEGEVVRDLGEFEGQQTVATAVNDHGAVVGWFGSGVDTVFSGDPWQYKDIFPESTTSRAFLWSDDNGEASWTDLGTLVSGNTRQSAAYAINNAGQVVGYSETSNGDYHAFLYTPEDGMRDLNTLIPLDSGWLLEVAHGINSHGQIVGWGTLNGIRRAFLLTPEGVTPSLDIAIHHSTVPQYPRAGEPFTLSSTVVNQGATDITVELEHTLPLWLDVVSVPSNCNQSGQQLVCGLGDVPAGASGTHSIGLNTPLWGRWEVTSTAKAKTEDGIERLAEVETFLQVARHEPQVVPTYTVIDLGEDVSKVDDQGPRINNWGEAALGGEDGAIFSEGSVKFAGGVTEVLYDVNDQGWFAGNTGTHAALWNAGVWSTLGGFPDGGASEAFGVNANNQVVGVATRPLNLPEAYMISLDADAQGLGAFDGEASEARDINDEGWIVGRSDLQAGKARAFLYRTPSEGLLDLGTLGGDDSWAYAISNSGVIVGQAQTTEGGRHAARWTEEGDIADLGALIEGGDSRAFDVNDAGIAVGDAMGLGGLRRAVRFVDGEVEDMNDWLPAGSVWQLDKASGINDRDEIVGIGQFVDDDTPRAYLALPLSPPLFAAEERLPPPDHLSALDAGHGIAFDGETLAIGNPGDDQLGEQTGAVHIYQRVNDEWVYRTAVRAPVGSAGDQMFGKAVALEGAWLVVGVENGFYIYQGFGATWIPVGGKITGSRELSFSTVYALDLEGETMAVAYGAGTEERVLIYTLVDGVWEEQGDVYSGNVTFTGGIRLDGDRLAIGVTNALHIYVRHDNSWSLEQTIGETFGGGMAFNDDTIVVGAPSDNQVIVGRGRAYVYKRRDDRWLQHAILPSVPVYASGPDESRLSFYASVDVDSDGEQFAYSAAVSGDVIAIGATSVNDGEYEAGAVYIYQLHGNQWIEEAKLIASDEQVNQRLGWTVALEDGILVSGTIVRPDGAVYSYTLNHSPDSADLQLSMAADRNAVGVTEFVTFTLTANNLSDVEATGIEVAVALPPELGFVTASSECGPEAGVIICHIDTLPVAAFRQVAITVEALAEGEVNSQAWVSAYQHDPNQSDNEVSVDTLVESEPPPRIVMLEPLDGANVTLSPHDTLNLRFKVEHFSLEPPEGRHVHWVLDNQAQNDLYDDVVDITGLSEGEHTIGLALAEANHAEVTEAVVTRFNIERPPWPSVTITAPENGGVFVENQPIQLRYTLDYAGVATEPQDFLLAVNGGAETPLADRASVIFDSLSPGNYQITFRYSASSEADATVAFTVLANEEMSDTDEEQIRAGGTGSSGGGGRLNWLAVVLLLALVTIRRLKFIR